MIMRNENEYESQEAETEVETRHETEAEAEAEAGQLQKQVKPSKNTISVPVPIKFWTEDPNILLKQTYIFELFPTSDMTFNQKLNAISRLVIFTTIILVIITRSFRIVFGAIITLVAIFLLHKYKSKDDKETFSNSNKPSPIAQQTLIDNNIHMNTDTLHVFDTSTPKNPFSNVLVTDYGSNPHKLPAPSLSDTNVTNTVLENAKILVQEANPGQPDIADKLFNNLNEQFNFEQSLRPFFSNANTTIPNDQGAFAEFCYGNMKSCKEGNLFACARNTSHYTLY
jgi:hypothetical protein